MTILPVIRILFRRRTMVTYTNLTKTLVEPKAVTSSAARSNQLLQFLSVHLWKPGYNPALERKRMSAQKISAMLGIETRMSIVHHSHCNSARKPRFHWDLHPVLIQGSQDLEHGQHLGYNRPHRRVCKVSPDADASTESKRDMFSVVRLEGTVVVEESLGYEFVWFGVPRFVMPHRPGKSDCQSQV